MFENAIPLDHKKHRHLRFAPNQPYHFASQEMLVPVVSGEIQMVAREYPVIFPESSGMPVALLGLDKGHNLHVQKSGHWVGRYVPAHIRRYPFIAVLNQQGSSQDKQQYILLVDQQAPHITADQGERIYTDDGRESPLLEKVIQVLKSLLQDELRTTRLVEQLDKAGVLVSRNLKIGNDRAVTGFRVVDRQALAKLDPEAVSELNTSGALMLAYAHLVSLTNLRDGLLAQKKKEEKPGEEDFLWDDDIKFDF